MLDGEAVAIPAEATLYMVTLHGEVSGNNVLNGGGDQVAMMGQPGRKGWPIIKNIGTTVFSIVEGLLKYIGCFPEVEHRVLRFQKRKVVTSWFSLVCHDTFCLIRYCQKKTRRFWRVPNSCLASVNPPCGS